MDSRDNFQKQLDEKIQILQDCQSSNHLSSCLKCEKIIECKIRKDYVDSLYMNLSKGNSGFFNFETE